MAKIKIGKSDKTIKKEQDKTKIESFKNKKNVTNDELKELLLIILERLEV